MTIYHITSPNICALVIPDSNIPTFVEGSPESVIYAPDNTSFEEFLTKDAAAARAKELCPQYNMDAIYGPLIFDPVNISNSNQSAYVGDTLTLNCEYACGDCEVVYQWLNPGGLPIPGATSSSLTLSNLTEKLDGVYTCNASAQNEKGQTGSASGSFKVTVYPAITPGAVAE